jgi:hypothetical protein
MMSQDLTIEETTRLARELVDEGWRDMMRRVGGAFSGPDRPGSPPRAHEPEDKEDIEDITTVAEPDPGGAAIPGEVSVDTSDELSQDTPLSVTKRQPALKVGPGKNPQQIRAGGQKEAPLVMQLQKIGMSQQSAQQIAKRIAQYLQQRKIPIAEGIQYLLDKGFLQSALALMESSRVLKEATDISRLKSSIFGNMGALLKDKASPEQKAKSAQYVLAIHNVVNQPDPEKFREFLRKRFSGWSETIDDIAAEELKQLMGYVKTSDKFQKYHQIGSELRQAKAAGKAQRRGDIRGVGKGINKAATTIIGKIISRFVSDNQQLLDKDPALQAIFDDPRKFNKLQKSVTSMLARQMQRRGYDAAQIQKFIGKKPPENVGPVAEELVTECVREMTNLLVTTNRINRWKALSGAR